MIDTIDIQIARTTLILILSGWSVLCFITAIVLVRMSAYNEFLERRLRSN